MTITHNHCCQPVTILEPIEKLRRDIRTAAVTLSEREARYLVDSYYIMQDDRKRAHNQDLNSVQQLANVPCPACARLCRETERCQDDYFGGSYCHCIQKETCLSCHGTGRKHWQLLRKCKGISHYPSSGGNSGNCDLCSGSGWVLKPESEWMGVLVKMVLDCSVFYVPQVNLWRASVVLPDHKNGNSREGTPEEALAAAILQALGVAK